jgi:hypothetical protein
MYSGDEINEGEMDGAYDAYGVGEGCIRRFDGGNMRERDSLEGLGVDGRIILKWMFKK